MLYSRTRAVAWALLFVALSGASAPSQAQSWNLYGTNPSTGQPYTSGPTISFANGPMSSTNGPAVSLSVGNSGARTFIMDTGSNGVLVTPDIYTPGPGDKFLGTGTETLTSSGNIYNGNLYQTNVAINGVPSGGGTPVPVATASVAVLQVTSVACQPGARSCTPNNNPTGIQYMGVGFNRNVSTVTPTGSTPATINTNPFINIVSLGPNGLPATNLLPGYIVTNSGVTLGLSSNATSNFAFVKLTPDPTVSPTSQPGTVWMQAPATVSVGGNVGSGTILPDTGIDYSFLTPPTFVGIGPCATNPPGGSNCLPVNVPVQVFLPGQTTPLLAAYSLTAAGSPLAPASVVMNPPSSSTFLNTGRLFYQGFDYLYDPTNGYVGYQSESSFAAVTRALALTSNVNLPAGFANSLPTVLTGATTLLGSGTGAISSTISGSGGLTIGSGQMNLTGSNTYTGGTVVMSGATVGIAADSGLGDPSGGLKLAGGTLQALGSFSSARAVTLDSGGGGRFDTNGNNVTMSGAISGVGGLTKDGTGTMTLSGGNTYSGGTTVAAGTLAGTTTSLQGNIANQGAVVFNQPGAGTYAGTMSGGGSLAVQGGGTVTLSGANSYSGGTAVSGATLQGTTTSLQGNIANQGAVVFNQASAGTYAGTMSGSGSLAVQGSGTVTLSGVNSYSGGTTVSGATLQGNAGSLQGNILNNGSVGFSQSAAGTFAGNIGGSGNLTLQGGGQLTLTGASSYTGPTVVTASSLIVNGRLASSVALGAGSTIGGSGTIGGLAASNAVISPGNSIGTLTVTGNFAQNGGTYVVEANAGGQADRVNVGGTATINGGAVQVLAQPGTYARNTTYTILSAAGGLTGAYAGVTSNFAFLTPSLSYDGNNAYLLLSQAGNAFAAGARTPNQYAVGAALDQASPNATGDFATVLNALSSLNTTQGPAALNAISGQNYAGFSSSMVQGAQLFMNNFANQIGGGGSPVGNRVALAEACEVACDAGTPPLWGAWGGALGGLGTIGANAATGSVTYNVGGFAAGLDRLVTPSFRAGVTVGYTTGTQWVSGFSGNGTTDSFLTGLYANYRQDKVYADAVAGYAYSYNQMWRQITIPGLQQRTAQGRTGSNQFYGQLEGGYRFDLGTTADAFVTPFMRWQGYTGTQNGFTETGAQSLNLTVAQQTTNSLRSVIGAQLGGAIDLGWREKLALQFRLGWSHEYASTSRPVTAALGGAPLSPFTTYGIAPQRDGAVVGFSANTAVADGTSLYVRYEGNISGQDSAHTLTAGVRMTW